MNQRLDPAHPYRKYWVCSCEEINSEEVNICGGCGGSLISWARSMLIPVADHDDVRKLVQVLRNGVTDARIHCGEQASTQDWCDLADAALEPFKEVK